MSTHSKSVIGALVPIFMGLVLLSASSSAQDNAPEPEGWSNFKGCKRDNILDSDRVFEQAMSGGGDGRMTYPDVVKKGYMAVSLQDPGLPKGSICDSCSYGLMAVQHSRNKRISGSFMIPASPEDGDTIFVHVSDDRSEAPGHKTWPQQGKKERNTYTFTWEPDTTRPGHTLVKWYLDGGEVGSWSFPVQGFQPVIDTYALRMLFDDYRSSATVGNCD